MNSKNRKPKTPVVVEQPKAVVEEKVLSLANKSCDACVPNSEVEALVRTALAKAQLQADIDITKFKKELADANSLLGRQRGDLENLRQKADLDKKVIAGLKTELNKLNAFGRWLYGITY